MGLLGPRNGRDKSPAAIDARKIVDPVDKPQCAWRRKTLFA